jgi:hypothetical protein
VEKMVDNLETTSKDTPEIEGHSVSKDVDMLARELARVTEKMVSDAFMAGWKCADDSLKLPHEQRLQVKQLAMDEVRQIVHNYYPVSKEQDHLRTIE